MKRSAALQIVLAYARAGPPEVRAAAEALEKPAEKRAAEVSERGLKFAAWFRTTLSPTMQLPPSWRESWARCFDDLLRLDGRTDEEIARVCQWARKHEFWRSHFLSPLKLRERKSGVLYFDKFAEAMRAPGGGGKKRAGQSRGYELDAAPAGKPGRVLGPEDFPE